MLTTVRIDSKHLAGNLIGDPSVRDLVVYLPPGYDEASDCRYPVAYLLHGGFFTALDWTRPFAFSSYLLQPIDEILDPVMARLPGREMIVAMPDGWSRYGCSLWVDSPVNGNFERYVLDEIVPYMDAHYRTIPEAATRGVFGISGGGIGAWHLGSRHPDVFGALAMLSAPAYFEYCLRRFVYAYYTSIYPEPPDGPTESNFNARVAYLFAAAYSPNPDNPPCYVDLPFEFPSGAPIPEVWGKWLAHDPVINWEERAENLRRLRGIFMEVGSQDDFAYQFGHRILSQQLTQAGIPHQAGEHDGTHAGHMYRQHQQAVAWLAETLVYDAH